MVVVCKYVKTKSLRGYLVGIVCHTLVGVGIVRCEKKEGFVRVF